MLCEVCGSNNVYVADNVFVPPNNLIYRRRKCRKCGNVFFTVEYICESEDDLVKQEWNKWHRLSVTRQKIRDAHERSKDEL